MRILDKPLIKWWETPRHHLKNGGSRINPRWIVERPLGIAWRMRILDKLLASWWEASRHHLGNGRSWINPWRIGERPLGITWRIGIPNQLLMNWWEAPRHLLKNEDPRSTPGDCGDIDLGRPNQFSSKRVAESPHLRSVVKECMLKIYYFYLKNKLTFSLRIIHHKVIRWDSRSLKSLVWNNKIGN
jgi:hypothetical protein